jgi:hypothetical protein
MEKKALNTVLRFDVKKTTVDPIVLIEIFLNDFLPSVVLVIYDINI